MTSAMVSAGMTMVDDGSGGWDMACFQDSKKPFPNGEKDRQGHGVYTSPVWGICYQARVFESNCQKSLVCWGLS